MPLSLFHNHFLSPEADKVGTRDPGAMLRLHQPQAGVSPTYLEFLPILRVPVSWHSQQHIWKVIDLGQKAATGMQAPYASQPGVNLSVPILASGIEGCQGSEHSVRPSSQVNKVPWVVGASET